MDAWAYCIHFHYWNAQLIFTRLFLKARRKNNNNNNNNRLMVLKALENPNYATLNAAHSFDVFVNINTHRKKIHFHKPFFFSFSLPTVEVWFWCIHFNLMEFLPDTFFFLSLISNDWFHKVAVELKGLKWVYWFKTQNPFPNKKKNKNPIQWFSI